MSSPSGQMWFSPVVSGTRLEPVWTNWWVTCANTAEEPLALTLVYQKLSSDFSAAKYLKQLRWVQVTRQPAGRGTLPTTLAQLTKYRFLILLKISVERWQDCEWATFQLRIWLDFCDCNQSRNHRSQYTVEVKHMTLSLLNRDALQMDYCVKDYLSCPHGCMAETTDRPL